MTTPGRDDLPAYVCGELNADRAAALEARLAADSALAAEAEAMRDAWQQLIAERGPAALSDEAIADLKTRWLADDSETEQWLAAAAAEPSPDFAERLRARYVRSMAKPRRWLTRSLIGMAACLLISAGVWLTLLQPQPTQAYDITSAAQRLQEVTSLYLRGTFYYHSWVDKDAPPKAQVYQRYVEKPYLGYGTFFGEIDGYVVMDSEKVVKVNHTEKTYTRFPRHPFTAKLGLEYTFRNDLVQRLYGDPESGYDLVGTEREDDRILEIYEQVSTTRNIRNRRLIWFDPSTGLVRRTKHYEKRGSQDELYSGGFDVIRYNSPPPEGLINFEPPPGYEVTILDEKPYAPAISSGGAGKDNQMLRVIEHCFFNINDRAALLGWALVVEEDDKVVAEPWLHAEQPFEVRRRTKEPIWPHHIRMLRIDDRGDFHSRWTLIIPESPDVKISESDFHMRFSTEDGKRGIYGVGYSPLKLEREKLKAFLEEAQRATLPSGADEDQIFTLEELERIIDEYQYPTGRTDAGRDALKIADPSVTIKACLVPTF